MGSDKLEEISLRVLKGFRDFLPEDAYRRERAISVLQRSFYCHGFQPIDTPVLEYTNILLGKSGGETEKQIFRFQDAGGRDVAMRFDLTVPLARFWVMHQHLLKIPFRCYHIDKVWRGENPQKGRYREFYQSDFDIIGTESLQADLDILLVSYDSLRALGLNEFRIHISHRQLIVSILDFWGLNHCEKRVLLQLDKFSKQDPQESYKIFSELLGDKVDSFWELIFPQVDWKIQIYKLRQLYSTSDTIAQIIQYLEELCSFLDELGIGNFFVYNASIVRGLDYYTGLVFETFLDNDPEIGSVCSGGRYDHLTRTYNGNNTTGVGGSIGLDRLLDALKHKKLDTDTSSSVDVMMMYSQDMKAQQRLCRFLQGHGFVSMCFPDDKKLKYQFCYAEENQVSCVVFYDQSDHKYTIRDLKSRKDYIFKDISESIIILKSILSYGNT